MDGFGIVRRNGDVFLVAVSPEDYDRVIEADAEAPWSLKPDQRTFYVHRAVKDDSKASGWRSETLHRFLMGRGVDHKDLNGLNNTRENLRSATQAENLQNKRLYKNNTSGYRGVSRWPNGKWNAHVRVNRHLYHLGTHETKELANAAVVAARRRLMPFSTG